eukprot:1141228-Pelagomonas_calceolata.AAC.2
MAGGDCPPERVYRVYKESHQPKQKIARLQHKEEIAKEALVKIEFVSAQASEGPHTPMRHR